VKDVIRRIGDKVLDGELLTEAEAATLLETGPSDMVELLGIANRVRYQFLGDTVEFCTIINAKSGRCSEDCRFCAQSGHHEGEAETYPMLKADRIVAAARDAHQKGIQRFSIVTSGRGLTDKDRETVCTAAAGIHEDSGILVDASLGFLTDDEAAALKDAGVERYHHNLETAESFFGRICTTHSFADKIETICRAKDAGMTVCSGGILGMGESPDQWLEMVFRLRDLAVDCIPVNVLNPRPGTPLAHNQAPSPLEVLKILAIMRLIVPNTEIKLAGGREVNLRDFQGTAFLAGVTGMIVGGYLTTPGRSVEEDLRLIEDLGLSLNN
jgi:biotin synthase